MKNAVLAPANITRDMVALTDCDFGCERLALCRNGYTPDTFDRSEILEVIELLTEPMRLHVNDDHRYLWLWFSELTHSGCGIANDRDWSESWRALVDVSILRAPQDRKPGPATRLAYVRGILAGPLAVALLEGALRRRSDGHIASDGRVLRPFTVRVNGGNKNISGGRVNQIGVGMALYKKLLSRNAQTSAAFTALLTGVSNAWNAPDAIQLVSGWRNELAHGEKFWQERFPFLLNLICFVIAESLTDQEYFEIREVRSRRRGVYYPPRT